MIYELLDSNIRDEGAKMISEVLKINSTLKYLNMGSILLLKIKIIKYNKIGIIINRE